MQLEEIYKTDEQIGAALGVTGNTISKVRNGQKPSRRMFFLAQERIKENLFKKTEAEENLSAWMARTGLSTKQIEDKCLRVLGEITLRRQSEIEAVTVPIAQDVVDKSFAELLSAPKAVGTAKTDVQPDRPLKNQSDQSKKPRKKGSTA